MAAGRIERFGRDERGGAALILGLAMPALAVALAGAMDLNAWWTAKARLQVAADGAALTAARELRLATASAATVSRVAEDYVRLKLAGDGMVPREVRASAERDARTVTVEVAADVDRLFSEALGSGRKRVSTSATAKLTSRAPVCVLGLDRRQPGTVQLMASARLTAERCAVYSNSSDRRALAAEDRAKASAALFCATGGVSGRKASFSPDPVTDCPVVEDPLAARPPPPVGPCAATRKVVRKGAETLTPGTYCGGLTITDGASATLLSGVYVIKDGPLVVNRGGRLAGAHVGLFFSGDKAALLFDKDSVVSLTAPKDGPMAGLLLFEERAVSKPDPAPTPDPIRGLLAALPPLLPTGAPPMREYRIVSDEARTLLGTIYLPSGRLMIDSSKAVADRSAYTVVVARRLDLFEGPDLHLNTDYGATDIPVPNGVGPVPASVALTR